MLFKEVGVETFEERKFLVSYKSNNNNPLYGYDFQITELLEGGDSLTIMVTERALYYIFNRNKIISHLALPTVVDLGSTIEYLRYALIFDEVFKPFINGNFENITLLDSLDHYHLILKKGELVTQEIVLVKNLLLPLKYFEAIRDPNFNFTQKTEINFSFEENFNVLPESVFSTDYYLSKGYKINHVHSSVDAPLTDNQVFSEEQQHLLLSYPLIFANGDTIRIQDYFPNYVLLDFWFASCRPCLNALPELNDLNESYAKYGLKIIGVNCLDMASRANVVEMIQKQNILLPLLFGPRNLTETLGITTYPSYYLISPNGQIELIHGGTEAVSKIIEERFNDR